MADENASPITAAKPPVSNPVTGGATLRLKPVIRKPGAAPIGPKLPRKPEVAKAEPVSGEKPLEQLKGITQKLKGVTQAIPQQAILRKTGIIAEQDLTEAQKAASKSRTSRISLSDAIGAAPVKNEAAPMKTIRIKRPVDLSSGAAAAASADVAPDEATVTQRKTLKIARPGAKAVVRKPAAPAVEKAVDSSDNVADIPDIPEMPAVTAVPAPLPGNRVPALGKGMGVSGLVVLLAACAAMGFLAWMLYTDTTILPF